MKPTFYLFFRTAVYYWILGKRVMNAIPTKIIPIASSVTGKNSAATKTAATTSKIESHF